MFEVFTGHAAERDGKDERHGISGDNPRHTLEMW